MKAISIWNPFAMMIVRGFKVFETRTWPAPHSIIGKRIAIASTRTIRPEQRSYFNAPEFRHFYDALGLPDRIEDMPNGFVLGTVKVTGVEVMTEEFLDEVSLEEQAYGYWEPGNYAWRLEEPEAFDVPIAVRGSQGLYEWRGIGAVQEEGRAQARA